jgi:xanthine dehydrogenase large subunit
MKQLPTRTVGQPLAHDSAVLHVAGSATYIDDIREPDGVLHVVPGYARDAAKGKLLKVDLEAVRGAPGIVAVLTAADIPGVNDCSPALGDDPIFAKGEIAFHGQVIFAVVAETRDAGKN